MTSTTRKGAVFALLMASLLRPCSRADAADPLVFFGGRLRLGGLFTGTVSPDDDGYFNFVGYDDYGTSALRRLRLALDAELRLGERAAVLAEVQSDNLEAPRVYALFLRLRPWRETPFDIQVGRLPPVFGRFPRHRYAGENPLPGLPMIYQYATTLREDAVPASAEELLSKRGQGWRVRYSVGSPYAGPGVPLASAEIWDTGVQARIGLRPVSLAVSLTQGTLSRPLVEDDNDGKQLAARLAWAPGPDLTLGFSASRGEFLAREVTETLPPGAGPDSHQSALGLDAEYARGHWILRGEILWSRWTLLPLEETRIETPQDVLGGYVEARYKLAPGLFVAGRGGHLSFSSLRASSREETWDANVTRVELGVGYAFHRQVLLKAAVQHNWRDGGYVEREGLVAAQVALWF